MGNFHSDPVCTDPVQNFEDINFLKVGSRDNPGTTRRLTRGKSLYFLCFEANT